MFPNDVQRIRIGQWIVDRSDGALTFGDRTIRLEPKALDVLLYLVDRPGTVVSQSELLAEVWRDTHLAPGAVARTISQLRTALGDLAYQPSYIETVPKRGYRLIAAVEQSVETAVEVRKDSHRLRAGLMVATAASLMVIAGGGRVMHAHSMWQFDHRSRVGNEQAFDHFTMMIEHDPKSADAHAGLSIVYTFRANYLGDRQRWAAAAVEEARVAMALDPRGASPAHAAGLALMQAGRLQEAEQHLRRAFALDPSEYGLPMNLALALILRGNVDEATTIMRAKVALHPHAPSFDFLSQALWLAGRLDEAVDAAKRATEIEPLSQAPQLLLIRYDLIKGAHESASSRLTRLLQAYPDCSTCVTQLGLIEQLEGRLSTAEARYRESSSMKVPSEGAALRLAQVLMLRGKTAEATSLLEEIERDGMSDAAESPEASGPRWRLAAAASIRGDRSRASDWLIQSIRAGRRDFAWDAFDPCSRPFGRFHRPRPYWAKSNYRRACWAIAP